MRSSFSRSHLTPLSFVSGYTPFRKARRPSARSMRNVADGAYPPYTRSARATGEPRSFTTSSLIARGTADQGGLVSAPVRDNGPQLLPGFARLFDRALVLDGRDVARVFAEDHRLQDAPHDLPAPRLRQHVDEVQLADDRERPELLPHGREQLGLQRVGRRVALPQHDERRDDLAAKLVGPSGYAGLGDRGVAKERRLDLDRPDAVIGDLDDLVGPPAEPDIPVGVDGGR